MKDKNLIKLTIVLFLICTIFLIFKIQLITASSQIAEVPDICLEYNELYDIILDDYYSIDQFETITVKGKCQSCSPKHIWEIEAGYAILKDLYGTEYDFSYYFKHHPTIDDPTKDFLSIQTYTNYTVLDITLNFSSDVSLKQKFTITINETCVESETPVTPPVSYNFSESYFDDLVAWYTFDYPTDVDSFIHNVYQNKLNFVNIGGDPDIMANRGKIDSGLSLDGSSYIYTNYLNEVIFPNNEFTACYWSNMTFFGEDRTIFYIKNKTGSGEDILNYFNHGATVYYQVNMDSRAFTHQSSPSVNQWEYICFRYWGNNNYRFWKNGANQSNTLLGSGTPDINDFSDIVFYLGGTASYGKYLGIIDDFAIWNRSLTDAELTSLYNNSNGIRFNSTASSVAPSISSIADQYMSGSTTLDINLDSYISGWEDIYIYYQDPLSRKYLKLYTGYETLNDDFFDLKLYNNGTLTITSYARSHDVNLTVYGCVYNNYELCSQESFYTYISSDLGNVTVRYPMEAYYNLGFDGSKILSGNYFFTYYDNIKFLFPETNISGVLNSTFPYEYFEIENPSFNATYMVALNCDISQTHDIYNYYGDLNISVECGNNQVYYSVYPVTNYNQKVSLYAWNTHSSAAVNGTILAYNYNMPAGAEYGPTLADIPDDPNQTAIDNAIYSFEALLPSGLNKTNKNRVVFFVLLIVIGVVFVGLFKYSVSLAGYLSLFISIVLLFFFANANYITYFFPILLLIGTMIFGAIKFINGGT